MKEVTQSEFYAAMNPRNVHPHIVGKWDEATGYTSEWKEANSGRVVGRSQCGDCHGQGNGKRYWTNLNA